MDRLTPYPGNPRVITDAAIEKVVTSLVEFGWAGQYPVADKDGVTIIGHTRHRAARLISERALEIPGWPDTSTMPVVVRNDLTEEQVRALRLMDNRSHEESAWDDNLLAIELGSLGDFNIELTGFSVPEIDDLIASAMNAPTTSHDFEAVETQTKSSETAAETTSVAKDTRTEPPQQELYDTQATIGEYRFPIERGHYQDWLEELRQKNGFSKSEVIAEIKRRLGLPS